MKLGLTISNDGVVIPGYEYGSLSEGTKKPQIRDKLYLLSTRIGGLGALVDRGPYDDATSLGSRRCRTGAADRHSDAIPWTTDGHPAWERLRRNKYPMMPRRANPVPVVARQMSTDRRGKVRPSHDKNRENRHVDR